MPPPADAVYLILKADKVFVAVNGKTTA